MNSFKSYQLSSKTCPNLGAPSGFQGSDDQVRGIDSDSLTWRKLSTRSFDHIFLRMIKDCPAFPKISPKDVSSFKEQMTNEAISQTSSPILLKYCKELLENFNVLLKPVFIKGEPFLSKEDTELLQQIVRSNETYGYLNEKDANLLKEILELNLSQQANVIDRESLGNYESDDQQSEVQLLETLFIEEINEFDEKEFAWEVVEEIFSHRSYFERKFSEESLVETAVDKVKSRESMVSNRSSPSGIIISSALIPTARFSSTVLSDITEEEVVDSVTKVSSIPHFSLNLQEQLNDSIEPYSTEEKNKDKLVDPIAQNIEIMEPDDPDLFYDDILRDFEVPSGASTPVPPPSLWSHTESTSAKESASSLEMKLSPVSQKVSSFHPCTPSFSNRYDEDEPFTDPVYKKMEEKLIAAIASKISQKRELPMTLTVKTFKLYDIRRKKQEYIAIFMDIPINTAFIYQNATEACLCFEYEIKLMTFDELINEGKFYKIYLNSDEIQVKATNLEEVTNDPYELLKMMKPLKRPSISMKLVDKIRKNYAKYEDLFDDDDVELDLYSAKSESGTEDDLYSTRSLNTKVDSNQETNSSHMILKELNAKNSKPVGVLFDNEHYDPQLSARSKKSAYVQEVQDGEDRSREIQKENDFTSLLEKFYKVDPDTIMDLCNFLSSSNINDSHLRESREQK